MHSFCLRWKNSSKIDLQDHAKISTYWPLSTLIVKHVFFEKAFLIIIVQTFSCQVLFSLGEFSILLLVEALQGIEVFSDSQVV